MPAWQLLPSLVLPGARNMALDEAMSRRSAECGTVLLRVYGWTRPTLSLGRHQRAEGQYDREAAEVSGIDVVRRPTGGRAVLHWREITYCLTAPVDALGRPREAYGAINVLLVDALRTLGVEASVASPDRPPPRPTPGACFEEPVAGEIVAGGRKLVGSAQARIEGALLQHGSILIDDDQPLASALMMVRGAPPPPPPAATLRALIGRAPGLDEFRDALACAVSRHYGDAPRSECLDPWLENSAAELVGRYASYGWTWRR